MEESKINMFVTANMNKFNHVQMSDIKAKLTNLPDSKADAVMCIEFRDTTTMLIISILLGYLGIDSFMLGKIGIGVLKLLTWGLCCILWIVDIINIKKNTQNYNYQKFQEAFYRL